MARKKPGSAGEPLAGISQHDPGRGSGGAETFLVVGEREGTSSLAML